MFRLIWIVSIHIRSYLRRYMPTNIILDGVRTRRGLKWGLPVMLLALPYLYGASICVELIEDGAPGWLHLIVLLCIWNAMKMAWIGPISLILLARVRAQEMVARQHAKIAEADSHQEATDSGPVLAGAR